jgi:hypothetical protein
MQQYQPVANQEQPFQTLFATVLPSLELQLHRKSKKSNRKRKKFPQLRKKPAAIRLSFPKIQFIFCTCD